MATGDGPSSKDPRSGTGKGTKPTKSKSTRPAKASASSSASSKSPSLNAPDLSPAVVKGGILVFVAVVVGLFLLNGPDSGPAAPNVSGEDVEIDPTDTGSEDDGEIPVVTETTVPAVDVTTTTTPEALPPAEITVLVANASGTAGAAKLVKDDVAAAGFGTAEEANASITLGAEDPSQVLYTGTAEADALSVAEALGLDPSTVAPMPDPPVVADLRGATVVVVVAPDLVPATSG